MHHADHMEKLAGDEDARPGAGVTLRCNGNGTTTAEIELDSSGMDGGENRNLRSDNTVSGSAAG